MNVQLYDIAPLLRPYVKVICSLENDEHNNALPQFRVLPDTCVELFVNYIEASQTISGAGGVVTPSIARSPKQPQSFIISRMSRFMDVNTHGRSGCITVCFYSGAASQFFKLPMNEVSDILTDLSDLWKNTADEMTDRVCNATNNYERVAIIQDYLIKQFNQKRTEDQTIQHYLWQVNMHKGQLSVGQLSKKVNISERQLGRRFNEYIGLSPKEFTRVNRFIHSLTHLRKYPALSLTEVAYESGYYDQAHFIHEYKAFTGLTPGEVITAKNILY